MRCAKLFIVGLLNLSERQKMKRITIPAALISGFVEGMIIGIGVKTGIEPSKEGVSMTVLEALCKNPVTGAVSFCAQLWFFGFIFLVIGLAVMAEDIQVNGILYAIGLVIGFLFILTSH